MRRPQAARISPVRTCVACRTRRPKDELIRVTVAPDGAIVAEGARARAPGRGAYVCNAPACMNRAIESGALGRALKRKDLDRSKLRSEFRRLVDVQEVND
ncbi:MAG: YlxR family protein [Actinomycetota bacterium]